VRGAILKHIDGNKVEALLRDNHGASVSIGDGSRQKLQVDCEKCFGLCCVALHFSASEGFPSDKLAGKPCTKLQPDFRCSVHKSLREKGLKGCIAYDCLGSGQRVSQITFGGQDWQQNPASKKEMFDAFLIMWQLHELLWYLTEALTLQPANSLRSELSAILEETEGLTNLSSGALIKLNVAEHRARVNSLLLKTSQLVRAEVLKEQVAPAKGNKTLKRGADLIGADLRRTNLKGADLRGAYLIAADLRGTDLNGADLIGVDFRDADLRGADLSRSIFLTQAQINVAKGDAKTLDNLG
jgi:uncharacterized protein YjbI with pentapeptide repeats